VPTCGCFALPSVVTVVRKIFFPATIGEDQPRPGIVAVHSILDVFDHLSGRLALTAEGLEEGPRKPGHSGSLAKAQGIEIIKGIAINNTMALIMILLDYERALDRAVAIDEHKMRWEAIVYRA
jgi:hypothetical protein